MRMSLYVIQKLLPKWLIFKLKGTKRLMAYKYDYMFDYFVKLFVLLSWYILY